MLSLLHSFLLLLRTSALVPLLRRSALVLVAGGLVLAGLHTASPAQAQATVASATTRGLAVYYHGRRDPQTTMTAAHRTLPFGTWVRVTHQRTGRSVVVKINDRGPWDDYRRIIDLSTVAARQLGIISEGVAPVTVTVLR
jgi:rare lipoprotein A